MVKSMNKTLAISAIVLVAVIMGMSAVAPMIPEAYAEHGGKTPPPKACEKLLAVADKLAEIPPRLFVLLLHCEE